jgi:hypothetical protein
MSNIVVGVFENHSNLEDAVSELLVSGFSRDQLNAFLPRSAGYSGTPVDENAQSVFEGYGGAQDITQSFGNALAGYDEHAVYLDLLGNGRIILTVRTESEERVDRAVEVMSRHAPIDIAEYQSSAESAAAPKGRTDTAVVPEAPAEVVNSSLGKRKTARRSGRLRIF